MNCYRLEDLHVGARESFSVTVTDEMMERFMLLSGDTNPLHNSEDFANRHGYSGRVVFGMLCSSLYSTLAGVYLPGQNCLLHGVDIKFKKPVFIGDELTVTGEITSVSEALRRVEIKARTINQNGVTVNKAVIYAGVME